ncbi:MULTISPECIES: hypothetical protein [Enterobacteriaceae]|uniref:hypothetical protein n=1 Tax=Enterobacteriaceae TaxID=543 RepID=UPI002E27BF31|nr:hypothetical protein [Klebsiella pneumoniae]MED6004909.1 hypothetical protein [Klebsiella pneumoniae]MED6058277.1 hypothetical protein [Klebsiella pneumoniae]
MNKLELAQQYMVLVFSEAIQDFENIELHIKHLPRICFDMAEAMLAENEKRQDKSRPEVLEDFTLDWDKIPDWANFFAIDKDGLQYIYAYEPYLVIDRDYWADHEGLQDGHSEEVDIVKNYTGDWKNSLRKRP